MSISGTLFLKLVLKIKKIARKKTEFLSVYKQVIRNIININRK